MYGVPTVEGWNECLRTFEKRFRLRKMGMNSWFVFYEYYGSDLTMQKILSRVKPWKIEYSAQYISADHYQFDEKCLQPIKVDESHRFHSHLMDRCNKECQLFGLITFIDWVHFFVDYEARMGMRLYGLKALAYIVGECGEPFIENRKRIYQFTDVKCSYIMPTQVECCLQLCLIEADCWNDFTLNEGIYDLKVYVNHVTELSLVGERVLAKALGCCTAEDTSQKRYICRVSLRRIVYGYFKYLIGWPTYNNNKMRHVIAWVVKYYSFFSEKFISIYYGDEIYQTPGKAEIKHGRVHTDWNPNQVFMKSDDLFIECEEMLDICKPIPELHRLISVCLFVQFHPGNRYESRLLRLLLLLPMMGGFGRTHKNIVAPRSADNDSDIVNDIGTVLKRNVIAFHNEAVTHGYHPIKPGEWERVTSGFYKSTASAEKERINIKIKGKDTNVTVKTKGLVGLIKGSQVFTSDMKKKYDIFGEQLSTGTRDVVVKFTRTIYPMPLTVLAAQVAVSDHILRYTLTNSGTLNPTASVRACQISAGSSEARGSRLLDDIDLVYYSGSATKFVITVDFGEYDSHCTWRNFRGPIIDALKEVYASDTETLNGYTRSELVDYAHGPGRAHNTLWDIGRRIFRTTREKIDAAKKTEIWWQNYRKYLSVKRKVAAPVGVSLVFAPESTLADNDGECLVCSGYGEDFVYLTSHGSGELTTLLLNSIENLSISDLILDSAMIKKYVNVVVRRVVGDDMLKIAHVNDSNSFRNEGLSRLKNEVFRVVRESGHVVNPQKAFFGYGFVEYRQTHCLRGCIIPKDQVAIISSEKMKSVTDVQDVIISFKSTLMTKISRGFSERLAQNIFYYISIILGRISLKRYEIDAKLEKVYERKVYEATKNSDDHAERVIVKRQFFVPNWPWWFLPQSMNGLNLNISSFLLSGTESEIGYAVSVLSEDFKRVFLDCARCSTYFRWYSVEADDGHVTGIHNNIDKRFLSQLIPESTMLIQNTVRRMDLPIWWRDVPMQMIRRAVLMEQSLLARDYRKSELNAARTVLDVIRMGSSHVRHHVYTHEICNNILKNSGFSYGYDFIIENTREGDLVAEGVLPMDFFLDTNALALRLGFGYGNIDITYMGCKRMLERAIARDPLMRNIITAEALLNHVAEFDIDMYQTGKLVVILIGLGFTHDVAEGIAEGLIRTLEMGGLLLIRDNGLLADEFTLSLGSRSRPFHTSIQFNCNMAPEERTSMRLAVFSRECIYYLHEFKRFDGIMIAKKHLGPEIVNASLFLSRKRNVRRPRSLFSARAEMILSNALHG